MTIHTLKHAYYVIHALTANDKILSYLCIRAGESRDRQYLLMCLGACEDETLSGRLFLCFLDLYQSGRAEAFEECFVKNRAAWVVFLYFSGAPFLEKISEGLLPEQKAEFGLELIASVCMQNLPFYLQYETADMRNIVVDETGKLNINFVLYDPQVLEENMQFGDPILFLKVQKRLAECYRILFRDELKAGERSDLALFVRQLERAAFTGQAPLYLAYRRLYPGLPDFIKKCSLSRKSVLLPLWEKIYKNMNQIGQFCYCMCIGGLFGLLVYVCAAPDVSAGDGQKYASIGTLSLIENKEPAPRKQERNKSRQNFGAKRLEWKGKKQTVILKKTAKQKPQKEAAGETPVRKKELG